MKKRIVAIVLVLMCLAASALAEQKTVEQIVSDYNTLAVDDFIVDCIYDKDNDTVYWSMESKYTAAAWKEAFNVAYSDSITEFRSTLFVVADCIRQDLNETDRPYTSILAGLISSDGVVMIISNGFTAEWVGDFEDWNAYSAFYMNEKYLK